MTDPSAMPAGCCAGTALLMWCAETGNEPSDQATLPEIPEASPVYIPERRAIEKRKTRNGTSLKCPVTCCWEAMAASRMMYRARNGD